jgi:starch synthase (maltosyl-transferring)
VAPPGSDGTLGALAPVFRAIRELGLQVMMDLVINHTSKDSPLVAAHPTWFHRDASGAPASPSVRDPDDTRRVTVWGDLAEVDNAGSPDREALWAYWGQLLDRAMDLGVTGFRCDAAYKVPAELWKRLVGRAKSRAPGTLFLAETLGCEIADVETLAGVGFDYVYNSSKWWDGLAPWCLEQHERFRHVAPSVSFPESHDTPRLAEESGGSEAVQRQRYALAAVFSAGIQMTIGYEFGFRRALDVVKTRPADWEAPRLDLGGFLRRMNGLKAAHPLLATEGVLRVLDWSGTDVTALRRWSDETGTHRGVILMNRSVRGASQVRVVREELPPGARLLRPCRDEAPISGEPVPPAVWLAPAEIALLIPPPSPW